jgi:hypothetical protein
MEKVEAFTKRADEFEALAAEAQNDGLVASYTTIARSYRRLAEFVADLERRPGNNSAIRRLS